MGRVLSIPKLAASSALDLPMGSVPGATAADVKDAVDRMRHTNLCVRAMLDEGRVATLSRRC